MSLMVQDSNRSLSHMLQIWMNPNLAIGWYFFVVGTHLRGPYKRTMMLATQAQDTDNLPFHFHLCDSFWW